MPRNIPKSAARTWMKIDVVSTTPEVLQPFLGASIIGRARESGVVEVRTHSLHKWGLGAFTHVDDTPYGGGSGMILRCEPLFAAIEELSAEAPYDEVIFLTPDGEPLTQQLVNELSLKKSMLLVAGHFKGIDQRVRDTLVTREISIGDYVLTGGELPALVLIDAVVRLLPGAMSDPESALTDSFQDDLLDYPHYTKPAEFRSMSVPEVLLCGDHRRIEEWRRTQAVEKTRHRRPDLYRRYLGEED